MRILDAFASTETLAQTQTYVETYSVKCRMSGFQGTPCTRGALSARGQVSDDLRLVVTTTDTGKGWYEYTSTP